MDLDRYASYMSPLDLNVIWVEGTPITDQEIVSLDQIKYRIGLPSETTFADEALALYREVAIKQIEKYTGMTLLNLEWTGTFPEFWETMIFSKRPYFSFGSLQYVRRTDGEILTIDPENFIVSHNRRKKLVLAIGNDYDIPEVADRADAVRVTYTAGFGATSDDIPADIKMVVIDTVANIEQNPGLCSGKDVTSVIPAPSRRILDSYIVKGFTFV